MLTSRSARLGLASLFFGSLLGVAPTAHAYTVETQITAGCHERVTSDALREVRKTLPTAKAISLTDDEEALTEDLPFAVPGDLHDLAGVTLLVGVRDNDLAGLPPTSLDELVEITADDAEQREHCLRTRAEKEPGGSKQAVDDCRAFILETLVSTLDGLDAQGAPDPTNRQKVTLTLAVRGQIDYQLPVFWFRLGRAVHAIEDSFTHTWRSTKDPHKITVVLNWTDYADNSIDEAVTGPAHQSEMDRCDDPDALRSARRGLATEAATAAMNVALDPSLSREQKTKRFQDVIDTYVSYDDGANCTADNGWCNAPERQYSASSCGCSSVGSDVDGRAAALGAALVLALFVVRRRRKLAPPMLAIALLFMANRASAQEADAGAAEPPPATPGGEAVPGVPPPQPVQPPPETSSGTGPVNALAGKSASGQPGVEDRAGAVFASIGFGASYDRSALVGRIGGRYALSRMWMLGLDAEWNPYLSVGQSNFRAGGLDVYASLIARFQLAYEPINLRSSASLGGSMLLFDLVGAPAGSIGPYLGISLLGLEFKLGKGFYLTVDPDSIAVPVPHVTGIPFVYYQYRFQVGLEFGG